MRRQLAAVLFALAPALVLAQGIPFQPPTQPVLSIELVAAAPNPGYGTAYERIGLKPTSFRVSDSKLMTGATWRSFTEGATTTSVINGRTHVKGTVSPGVLEWGASCGNTSVWVRTFLQFRVTPLGGTPIVSNVKGDSVCFVFGG